MKKIYLSLFILTCFFTTEKINAQTEITFYTSMGTFEAEMYESFMPITAGNFIDLVNDKFYDSIIFHRVIDGFVIQGGDPTGTGYGGPGYTIPDEFHPDASNVQMSLGMANSGPDTGGSQFYINLVDNVYLDPDYPVFGIVISNFSVVEDIGNVDTDINDRPLEDVVMDSVRVTFDPYAVAVEDAASEEFSITVSPSPITSESIIEINALHPQSVILSVYNQTGTKLYSTQQQLHKGTTLFSTRELNLSNAAVGIYYMVISDGKSLAKTQILMVY